MDSGGFGTGDTTRVRFLIQDVLFQAGRQELR